MDFEKIKSYWNNRAELDSSSQSTTNDIYFREIEHKVVSKYVKLYSPGTVADVGCGDARTLIRVAGDHPRINFKGFDYSSSMVKLASKTVSYSNIKNIKLDTIDICDGVPETFDLVYTTRCLINLPSWEMQMQAIKNIYDALSVGGVYVMIENFIHGQNNFNALRREYGLPEINIRDHNKYFDKDVLIDFVDSLFTVEQDINISSTYYLTTRVIYSKLCKERGVEPDYFDDHHRYAVGLPFSGEFGPIRLICMRKK